MCANQNIFQVKFAYFSRQIADLFPFSKRGKKSYSDNKTSKRMHKIAKKKKTATQKQQQNGRAKKKVLDSEKKYGMEKA